MATDTNRYCLALDLIDDAELIAKYKEHHAAGNVWPEIITGIRESGIIGMNIYHVGNRLFMIMEVDDSFSFKRKVELDARNPKTQEWEELMLNYHLKQWAVQNWREGT